MNKPFSDIISSEQELRDLLGYPSEVVNMKVITHLDSHCKRFISLSPLVFLSTANNTGQCDVSPRGDEAGSVKVLDHQHLVIAERPGNRRMDTLINILSNPSIGLIFIIPTLEETCRINGQAYIIKDQSILEQMSVEGKIPKLAIGVKVEECYIHCAKAFKRSKLWEPTSWSVRDNLPHIPTVISAHINSPNYTADVIEKGLQESYEKRLY